MGNDLSNGFNVSPTKFDDELKKNEAPTTRRKFYERKRKSIDWDKYTNSSVYYKDSMNLYEKKKLREQNEELMKKPTSNVRTIDYPDGNKYHGEMLNDKRYGYGIMYFANGDKYEGLWKDDLFSGKGNYFYANSNVFSGKFRNGQKNNGIMKLNSGNVYQGWFMKDKFNGFGTMQFENGDKYIGEWQNGQFHGKGAFLKFDNNETQVGYWQSGNFIKRDDRVASLLGIEIQDNKFQKNLRTIIRIVALVASTCLTYVFTNNVLTTIVIDAFVYLFLLLVLHKKR